MRYLAFDICYETNSYLALDSNKLGSSNMVNGGWGKTKCQETKLSSQHELETHVRGHHQVDINKSIHKLLMNLTQKKIKMTPSGKKRSGSTGMDFVQMLPLKTISLRIITH